VSRALVRVLLPAGAVLALAGIGIASYLTTVHYAGQPIVCSGVGDCERVNQSTYASLAGVPVALLGGLAYASLLALVGAAWLRRWAAPLALAWAIALAGFAFSMYLTYIELAILDAACVYCVASASIMTALLALLSACVWAARDELFGEEAGTLLQAVQAGSDEG